jgi:hypothetical protein
MQCLLLYFSCDIKYRISSSFLHIFAVYISDIPLGMDGWLICCIYNAEDSNVPSNSGMFLVYRIEECPSLYIKADH